EQNNLYTQGNIAAGPTLSASVLPDGSLTCSKIIPSLLCPADPDANKVWTNRANVGSTPMGPTSYQGVAGQNWAWGDARWNPVSGFSDGSGGPSTNGLDHGDGIFYRTDAINNPKLTLLGITDRPPTPLLTRPNLPPTHSSR